MSRKAIEIHDRYSALGIPRPVAETVCRGQCEGTGSVPVKRGERRPALARAWKVAESKNPAADGWHFVKCPTCKGTGKRKGAR